MTPVREFDEQERVASMIEATVLQSTADLIDFHEADSFEAAARDATKHSNGDGGGIRRPLATVAQVVGMA